MKYLVLTMGLPLIVWLLVACQPPSVGGATRAVELVKTKRSEVSVTKEVVPAPPLPTPAGCTPLPEGMALRAEPLSSTEVLVEIEGLQPGEEPLLIFHAESPGYEHQNEVRPVQPVGSDGRFELKERGLEPLPGSLTNRWTIKVVHARGVACTEVTLP